jgi:predicted metal-dependent HD superfamily phosphohydrolase
MPPLRDRWIQTCGATSHWSFRDIVRAYSEPHRHYHTLDHLEAGFKLMDDLFPKATPAVKLAYWFHDFIYDTHASDNEEKSAWIAGEFIRGNLNHHGHGAEVASLILATKHHSDVSSENTRILLDVDLSILSEPVEVFNKYEQDIRREYDWVPPEAYKAGRTKVLLSFLDRPAIYHTEAMKPREALARDNINRSLKNL